jgi:putative oxidoreductase
MQEALFILRLVVGSLMAAHGSQKLFGWFGGYGLLGTGGFLEMLGFRPGPLFARAAGLSEFIGGLLIAFGFLGPVGPALVLAVMIVAAVTVHWHNGLFAATNGIEVPLLYSTSAVALTLSGPGSYSLDNLFGLTSFWTPEVTGATLLVGVVGAIANLAARRPVPVEA